MRMLKSNYNRKVSRKRYEKDKDKIEELKNKRYN
jgi:hypothetical protein